MSLSSQAISLLWKLFSKLPALYNLLLYHKYIKVVRGLEDYEKLILNGLRDSPVSLDLHQAYKKSVGGAISGVDLFIFVNKEKLTDDLVGKRLVVKIKDGYILTREAEYAISKGVLRVIKK